MTIRVACLIVMTLHAGVASAAELGRLFFTPAQRATLDNARKQNNRLEISNDAEQSAAPLPQNVSVNGVIRRSDGKNTIWLNNRPIADSQSGPLNAAVSKNDNRVRLSVPESGRNLELKVGQTVEIVSGTVGENYLRRPAIKPDLKAAPSAENTAAAAPKDLQPQASNPGKPEQAQNGAARVTERAATNDAKPGSNSEQK